MKNGDQILSIAIDGRNFFISFDDRDKHMAPAVAAENTWEPWQLDLYRLAIEPNHTCFDAGANVGVNSIIMAHYASAGRVHSFEPVKRTREIFEKNKAANKSDNISIVGTGLGDQKASVTISVDTEALANANIVTGILSNDINWKYDDRVTFEQISLQRLDDYWTAVGRPEVNFLKIDVEGYEEKVLIGAPEFLQNNRDLFLICEINVHTQIRKHDLENSIVGTYELLVRLRKSFAKIYFMGRDSKLYLVSSYAQLRIHMLSGYPVDDIFCCNILPAKLKGKLAYGWTVPERLTTEFELTGTSSISYINRNVDGWCRPSAEISGTRGGAILHLSKDHAVKISIKEIIKPVSAAEKLPVIVTINDSTKVLNIDGASLEVEMSLSAGLHYVFVESLFEVEALEYFNNPADHRKIGAHFAVKIEPLD